MDKEQRDWLAKSEEGQAILTDYEALEALVGTFRLALDFYADPHTYGLHGGDAHRIYFDSGLKARTVRYYNPTTAHVRVKKMEDMAKLAVTLAEMSKGIIDSNEKLKEYEAVQATMATATEAYVELEEKTGKDVKEKNPKLDQPPVLDEIWEVPPETEVVSGP